MKKKSNDQDTPRPDLKHDTMEFSAATDGEDRLDIDDETYEEEEISEEELDFIDDNSGNAEKALSAAEHDAEDDVDNLPEEDWTDDLPDTGDEEDEEQESRR